MRSVCLTPCGVALVLLVGCGSGSGSTSSTPPPPDDPTPSWPSPTVPSSYAAVSGACAAEPLRATGVVRYVCDCQAGAAGACQQGDDTNDGLSPGHPLRTIARAAQIFTTMPAGSTVALCRGGAWNDVPYNLDWHNPSCSATSTCDLRDYLPAWADAGTGRPALRFVKNPAGADDQDSAFRLTRSDLHLAGLRFLNLDLAAQEHGWGFFIANGKDDVEVCNVRLDGFALPFYPAGGGHNHRVRMHGNEVRNTGADGMGFLGASEDGELSYNRWDACGAGTMLGHTIYVGSEAAPDHSALTTSGFRVIGNEITRSSHDATGTCVGTVIVVHGRLNGLVVEGNVIDEEKAGGGCYGIGIGTNGNGYENRFESSVIRGNVVKNVGYVSIDLDTTQNTLVEGNRVEVSWPGGVAIRAPGRAKEAVSPANTATVIRNNTLHFTSPANADQVPVVGIQVGIEGSGYVVASNVISYVGSRTGISCLRLDGGAAFSEVDHNSCTADSGAFSWGSWNGTSYPTLDAWRAATGFDAHSQTAAANAGELPSAH